MILFVIDICIITIRNMDTNSNSFNNQYFTYAIGVICFINILSSELSQRHTKHKEDSNLFEVASDCNQSIYYLI